MVVILQIISSVVSIKEHQLSEDIFLAVLDCLSGFTDRKTTLTSCWEL